MRGAPDAFRPRLAGRPRPSPLARVGDAEGARVAAGEVVEAPRELAEVERVVRGPGGEEHARVERAELRVCVGAREVGVGARGVEPGDVRRARGAEVGEDLRGIVLVVAPARGDVGEVELRPRCGGVAQRRREARLEVLALLVAEVAEDLEDRPVFGCGLPAEVGVGDGRRDRVERVGEACESVAQEGGGEWRGRLGAGGSFGGHVDVRSVRIRRRRRRARTFRASRRRLAARAVPRDSPAILRDFPPRPQPAPHCYSCRPAEEPPEGNTTCRP